MAGVQDPRRLFRGAQPKDVALPACLVFNPASDRADILPHNLKVHNLCRMKILGPEKWLAGDAGATTARYYRGRWSSEKVLKQVTSENPVNKYI
ncbi:MAG: hypothetical protein RQ767_01195 [Thermovirgaceae bacterium]|nr:hypothetical protein [Thermovirgaceae bacterium]